MDRFFSTLASWLFLVSGIALIGGVALMGPQQELRELSYQRDVAVRDAKVPLRQRQAMEQLLEGLYQFDVVVLESLAISYRNQRRIGVELIDDPVEWRGDNDGGYRISGDEPSPIRAWADQISIADLPDIEPARPTESRWERLSTGSNRYAILALGVICLMIGIIPPRDTTGSDAADA